MATDPVLPESFCRSMSAWMGSEWSSLRQALTTGEASRGVRLHRWTVEVPVAVPAPFDALAPTPVPVYAVGLPSPVPERILSAGLEPVKWARDAFHLPTGARWGKSIYHEAGAFYLQEPSAMAVVTALDPQPGERILDLCAAPGGKTTAIGRSLGATGLLVANEIHPQRVTVLAQNVERTGVLALIANESPQRLAAAWPGHFDAVLVDAPCSGEGMFRKSPSARQEWTDDAPHRCAARQRDILSAAVRLTRIGGRIVYSTCTLNPIENESVVAWALSELPVEVEHLPHWTGWSSGRTEWAGGVAAVQRTRRLWPHIGQGEGHFVARLRVIGTLEPVEPNTAPASTERQSLPAKRAGRLRQEVNRQSVDDAAAIRDWLAWASETCVAGIPQEWTDPFRSGNVLFTNLAQNLPLHGLRILRPGLPLADFARGRPIPHHALAMAIHPDKMLQTHAVNSQDAIHFLNGGTLPMSSSARAWYWIQINSLPLGWGKAAAGRLNNYYPKGLRKANLDKDL